MLVHLTLGLLLLAPTPPGCSEAPSPQAVETADPIAVGLAAHNRERARLGRPPLALDDRLSRVAQEQAEHCARTGRLSHQDSRGRWPWERLTLAGYRWSWASENAYSASWAATAEDAVQGWLWSRGHRQNVLERRAVHLGLGYADGRRGRFWIALYGQP